MTDLALEDVQPQLTVFTDHDFTRPAAGIESVKARCSCGWEETVPARGAPDAYLDHYRADHRDVIVRFGYPQHFTVRAP